MRRLLVLISAVLALAACQTPTPVTLHATTASYTVDLDLDAASPGARTVTIHVAGAEPTQVTLTTVMAHMNHPGPTVQAARLDDGQYQARGEFFTMLGDWRIEVRLHGPAGEEVALFEVTAAR